MRIVRATVVSVVALAAFSAAAQTPDARLRLRELTAEAVKSNPEILEARKKYEAAPEYQAVQREVVSRLNQAYYRLQHSYAALEVVGQHRQLFEALLQIATDRYAGGLADQTDAFKTQVQIGLLDAKAARLEQERSVREADIDAILNRAAGTTVARPEDSKPKEFTASLEDLLASARKNSTQPEAVGAPLRFRIQEAYFAAQASAKLMKIYSGTVAPQAGLALESSLVSYGDGKVDFLSVISDYLASFDCAMSYCDESLNYRLALSRLEELTGQPLTD